MVRIRTWARGSEDELHKLFHCLVRGKRKPEDFEHYYNQLYRLVPEWLEVRIRPRRRLTSEKTPKRIKMSCNQSKMETFKTCP